MKSNRYIIDYQVNSKCYNYSVKSISEEKALIKFEKIWDTMFKYIYPYPRYQILSIKEIMKKIII